jgi:hypothetical protein
MDVVDQAAGFVDLATTVVAVAVAGAAARAEVHGFDLLGNDFDAGAPVGVQLVFLTPRHEPLAGRVGQVGLPVP